MKASESKLIESVEEMCIRSLDPEAYEQWEKVKKQLIDNRKIGTNKEGIHTKMGIKLLPLIRFGELLQALYDSELNFTIEWMLDGGICWSFTQVSYEGADDCSMEVIEVIDSLVEKDIDWDKDYEILGSLIIIDYMAKYSKQVSLKSNKVCQFLIENGFLE